MAQARKHTPEQIVNILRQIEVAISNGKTAPAASREAGISEQTYYCWITESRSVSQEMLSRPNNAERPRKEQEFIELRIDDRTASWNPGFVVTEWRIRWAQSDQEFMWEDGQQESWATLQTAMSRYQARLRSLKELGFTHSDIEF
jgi:putative transposase